MPSVADRFARIAGGYDRLNRLLSLGLDVTWRWRALARLAALDAAPGRILDLATGTADFALAAARRFPRARVTGLDLTPAMLALARLKTAAAGLAGRLDLVQGDAAALPFAPASFDAALCAFGFRNFPDPAAALAQAARITKDGGHLVVLEFFRPQSRLLGALTAGWLAAAAPLVAGRAAADDYAYLRTSIARTCPAATFAAWAAAAGFAQVRADFFLPACTCLVLRKCGRMCPA